MKNLEKEKSVWVIGDIHGLYDPLKALIGEIRHKEYLRLISLKSDMREKHEVVLVFLGDYIDGGPSSKECVDYLMDLEFSFVDFRKVFLTGNHEDMLQQFLRRDEENIADIINDYGVMFFNGNSGQTTVESFMPTPEIAATMRASYIYEPTFEPEEFTLSKKYRHFFDNLKYSHKEILGNQKILFSHSSFAYQSKEDRNIEEKKALKEKEKINKDRKNGIYKNTSYTYPTLEEQLSVKNYDEYHEMRANRPCITKKLNLWNRDFPENKFDDYIVIQGHTPTQLLRHYMEAIPKEYNIESCIPFFFFDSYTEKMKTEKHQIQYDRISTSVTCDQVLDIKNKSFEDLISIDIDTGAVLGKALTAMNITEYDENGVDFIQIFLNRIHKKDCDVRFLRVNIPRKKDAM